MRYPAEIKNTLYRYPALEDEIDEIAGKMREAEATLAACYTVKGGTPDGEPHGSECGDPTSSAADRALKLRRVLVRLAKANAWRIEMRDMVDAYLDRLDALERPVIEARYFRRLPWEDIARLQAYSIATVYRVHASAMDKWPKVDSN